MSISGKINNSGYVNVPLPRWRLPRAFSVSLNLLPPSGRQGNLLLKPNNFSHSHPRLVIVNEGKSVQTLHEFLDRRPFGTFDELKRELSRAKEVRLVGIGDYSALCPSSFFRASIASADAGSIYADAYNGGAKKLAEFTYDRVSWGRVLFSWLRAKLSYIIGAC